MTAKRLVAIALSVPAILLLSIWMTGKRDDQPAGSIAAPDARGPALAEAARDSRPAPRLPVTPSRADERREPASVAAALPDSSGGPDSGRTRRFPDGAGRVVLSDESPLYSDDHREIGKVRTRVVKTPFMYPFVRVVEKFKNGPDGTLVPAGRVVAVADHAIVQLKDDQPESVLRDFAERNGYKIRKALPLPGSYLVEFEADRANSLDVAINKLKKSGIVQFAESDTIVGIR